MQLSRDGERLSRMAEAVGAYRVVFAQPRQTDLLAHLQRTHSPEELEKLAHDVAIDLRPPYTGRDAASDASERKD